MISLVSAALFFVGIHLFVSGTTLRDAIVARIGERAYLASFALASIGGLGWLIMAYARVESVPLWPHQSALRPLVLVLVFVAFLLVLIGLTTPSPTAAGGEGRLRHDDPAIGILRITRHPFLWGVAIWAAAHLLVNEDSASLVLFGSVGVLALAGPRSIDAKRKRRFGEDWDRFAAVTSNLPFAAIAAGRNRLVIGELGAWRVALGIAAFAVLLILHVRFFGVYPRPV
jgi:uncharacterized membrane protein